MVYNIYINICKNYNENFGYNTTAMLYRRKLYGYAKDDNGELIIDMQ